jgi:hypothetical protein
LYRDGVSRGTTTSSIDFNTTDQLGIGGAGKAPAGGSIGAYPVIGYMSNIRVVKGTAVYTGAFTPPTAPLTPVANTSLLLSGTNNGIYDATLQNNIQLSGNARVRTDVTKYGTGSMYFDGSSGYLLATATPALTFGTGNFTIEYWIYFNSTSEQGILGMRPQSTNGIYPVIYFLSNTLRFNVNGVDRITSSSLTTGTWYHIAVSRSGSSTKMFIDGTQVGSTYTDTNSYLCSRLVIGANDYTLGTLPLNGYIDDLRITKLARYTANFTPSTVAFNSKSRSN